MEINNWPDTVLKSDRINKTFMNNWPQFKSSRLRTDIKNDLC